LLDEFIDGFLGFALLVAKGDEAEDGIHLGFFEGIMGTLGGAGGLPGIDDADFVFEFEDDALGGLGADAFDAGEGFDVVANDGVFEVGDGHAAEDGKGHLGSDTGDAVDEEAEEVAFVCAEEAVEGMIAFGDVVMGEEGDFSAGMGKFVEGGERDQEGVADAADIDDGMVRHGGVKEATDEGDHGEMKAGDGEGCKGIEGSEGCGGAGGKKCSVLSREGFWL